MVYCQPWEQSVDQTGVKKNLTGLKLDKYRINICLWLYPVERLLLAINRAQYCLSVRSTLYMNPTKYHTGYTGRTSLTQAALSV